MIGSCNMKCVYHCQLVIQPVDHFVVRAVGRERRAASGGVFGPHIAPTLDLRARTDHLCSSIDPSLMQLDKRLLALVCGQQL